MAEFRSMGAMTARAPLRLTASGTSWAMPGVSPSASSRSAPGSSSGRNSDGSSMTRGMASGAAHAPTTQSGNSARTCATIRSPHKPCVRARILKIASRAPDDSPDFPPPQGDALGESLSVKYRNAGTFTSVVKVTPSVSQTSLKKTWGAAGRTRGGSPPPSARPTEVPARSMW